MLFISTFQYTSSFAQESRKIIGIVTDTSNRPLRGSEIVLTTRSDSVKTFSDKYGSFLFSNVSADSFSLSINLKGYQSTLISTKFDSTDPLVKTIRVALEASPILLNEVVIKEKPVPIILKKDTVEYNAASYKVEKNDFLINLLSQLPGFSIDNFGNVTTSGKALNVLKVNGKDFFSDNLAEFLRQLPAEIISKLQVIDDYGSEANFSGVKTGTPTKVLNLVIKPGLSSGRFGNITLYMGTNGDSGLDGNGNYWLGDKQISLNTKLNFGKNHYGLNLDNSVNGLYRNNVTTATTVTINYRFNSANEKSKTYNYSHIADITGGIDVAEDIDKARVRNDQTSLVNINYQPTSATYITFNTALGYNTDNSNSTAHNTQSGLVNQVLTSNLLLVERSPQISNTISLGHRFNSSGRLMTLSVLFGINKVRNSQAIFDNLFTTNIKTNQVQNILSNRRVSNNSSSDNLGLNILYSEPILEKIKLDFAYSYNANYNYNDFATSNIGIDNKPAPIDSLSNDIRAISKSQNFGISTTYNSKRLDLDVGFSVIGNTIVNSFSDGRAESQSANINLSPHVRISYLRSNNKTINFVYNASTAIPSYSQLQPIIDTRNIQNFIEGNPNLKPSLSHLISINYHSFNAKKNRDVIVRVGVNVNHNEISTNTFFLKDSMNNLQRVSRYENVNGSYSLFGTYNHNFPIASIAGAKYNLNFAGSASFTNNSALSESVAITNKNLKLMQSASIQFYLKKLYANTKVLYDFSSNNFSVEANNYTIRNFAFNVNSGYNFSDRLGLNLTVDKKLSTGLKSYVMNNPLVINISLQQKLFENNSASLDLEFHNLLNQDNNVSSFTSGNTIIESKDLRVNQCFKVSFTWRLSHFGK